jgi:N-carbamoyl-L-amino-acid hydrolase
VFSEADLRARAYVKKLFEDAGLVVSEDAVGNTFARWMGSEPQLGAIGTGSHIDAIPNAGLYDGCVGVLGGLEAIRVLQKLDFKPRRSIELVIFTAEEPTRFGIGCLGSRMMAGVLTPDRARELRDKDGRGLEELRAEAGFTGTLESVRMVTGRFHQFIELHIEQGPQLEQEGIDLGLVTHIAAPASMRITIEGEGGHAGARLMPGRKDALTAGAELILALEAAAKSTGVVDTVATVGICDVFPGAVNSIPSKVRLETDIRDIDAERRDRVIEGLQATCNEVSARRGVRITTEMINADPPTACDKAILDALEESAVAAGKSYKKMVSRAYHDSLFIARIAPVAMLFIPCRGGVSHRPDEYASPETIGSGVHVLARTLAQLAG